MIRQLLFYYTGLYDRTLMKSRSFYYPYAGLMPR